MFKTLLKRLKSQLFLFKEIEFSESLILKFMSLGFLFTSLIEEKIPAKIQECRNKVEKLELM